MRRLFLLLALVAVPALAQRTMAPRGPAAGTMPPAAAERYHQAARLYVDGQNAPALDAAEAAVAIAPNDARVVALRDLIKKKQDQQDQNQPNQDEQDDRQKPDDPQDDGGQEPPTNDPQAPDDQPGQGEQPNGGGAGQNQAMSAEQAERLLDAVGGDERMLLRQMRRPPSRVRTNEQDW